MNVKRMGITEILRRIWLFSANKIKISESFSKQPTQLIIQLKSSLRQIIVTIISLITRIASLFTLQIQIFDSFKTKIDLTDAISCFLSKFQCKQKQNKQPKYL